MVIVVNGLFSFWQEAKADHAVSELAALLPATAFVRRDGREREIPAAELVPGDVVLLREGDAVSADARVLRSSGLRIDESLLTGESVSVERDTIALDAPPADTLSASCLVFAGTYVVAGSGLVVVVATGGRTRLGGIAALTAGVERRATPLRDQLDRLVRTIAVLAIAVGVVFFGATLALGTDASDGFVLAVGVIVALVPEGPAADAVAVARGVRAPDGGSSRARASPRVGRDARRDHGDLHGQDGHPDRERDDRGGPRPERARVRDDRLRLRPARRDPRGRTTALRRGAREPPTAAARARALQRRTAGERRGTLALRRRPDRGRPAHGRPQGRGRGGRRGARGAQGSRLPLRLGAAAHVHHPPAPVGRGRGAREGLTGGRAHRMQSGRPSGRRGRSSTPR